MTIAAKVLPSECESECLRLQVANRIAEREYAQFDVGTQVLRILQNESEEVARCVQMEGLVLGHDVGGHSRVHGTTVSAPPWPIAHQREEPFISDSK